MPQEPLGCSSTRMEEYKLVGSSEGTGSSDQADKWVYPSQQRFYNAMKRKGWNPREEDLPYVLSFHNVINERAWQQVLEYEKLHEKECDAPKLLRFEGLPDTPSWKSQVKSLFGYVQPFDRHDWVIDRCGKEVRYVIDFYQGSQNPEAQVSIYIDARPAPDSISNLYDRFRMFVSTLW
uniref:Holocytochrome c-type synthase n=1 Tax=Lygus hesperus TaxID=30085 RepID=A0A0A9XZK1_LYGHE